jgi:hypothetical protein
VPAASNPMRINYSFGETFAIMPLMRQERVRRARQSRADLKYPLWEKDTLPKNASHQLPAMGHFHLPPVVAPYLSLSGNSGRLAPGPELPGGRGGDQDRWLARL